MPPSENRRIPQLPLWVAILAFVASRVLISFYLEPLGTDIGVYYQYALRGLDFKHVAYRDYPIEYPPVAWWAMALPRYFAEPIQANEPGIGRDELRRRARESYASYSRLFRLEMLACDVASFLLFVGIVRRQRPEMAGWLALGYSLTLAVLAHVLYDRLDVGLLLLILAWAYAWVRSIEGTHLGWQVASYLALGLSVSYKVIPGIILPPLLIAEWNSAGRIRRLGAALTAFAGGALVPFALQYVVSGPDVFKLFAQHAQRGVQIESVWGSLMMLFSVAGPQIDVVQSSGSSNLVGSLAEPMKTVSAVALGLLLFTTTCWCVARRVQHLEAYRVALLVLLSAVAVAKVFSPQYLIWTLPVATLLGAEVIERPGSVLAVLAATLGLAVVTTWIFPYNYFSVPVEGSLIVPSRFGIVPGLSPVGCAVLIARNIAYLCLVGWLGLNLFARRQTA